MPILTQSLKRLDTLIVILLLTLFQASPGAFAWQQPMQPEMATSGQTETLNIFENSSVAGFNKSNISHQSDNPLLAASKEETDNLDNLDPDNEVLNNILGTNEEAVPSNDNSVHPQQPGTSIQTGEHPSQSIQSEAQATEAPKRERQKHFSFLDPGAEDVLAPDFDYGVYSVSMRTLDDYRRRIQDALDSAKELSVDLPVDKIQALQRESNQHKKQFEALYLNNQTWKGLDEYAKAKKLALQALAIATPSQKVEARAIWLDRGTIIETGGPAGLKQLMQKLHRAGINIVYFETLNAGFPIYPSKILKHNPLVNGWDPLKVAVNEGHQLGMEVHAWVWTFAVGNRRHNPLIGKPDDYAGPILTEAGLMSEAMRNRDGSLGADGRQHEFWLSPASPKARDFLKNVFREIVTEYKVDGLHLDYIRYPFQSASNRMGYEPVARERFRQSTGMASDGMNDYGSRVWIAWKTYQVSSFVREVSETMRGIRPELQISAAVFPMKRDSRIVAIHQDWESWIDNGWIDTLSPMSYTSDPVRLQGIYDYVQSSPQKQALIYPGIAIRRLDGGQLVGHLEALRQKGSLGSTLFAGAHLDAEKIETLGNGPYKDQRSLPPHQDIVKSLNEILADYRQKLEQIQAKGTLDVLSSPQVEALKKVIHQFSSTLSAIGPARNVAEIEPAKVAQAQKQLQELQASNAQWTEAERPNYPFRAQYFDHNVLLLEKLMAYLSHKSSIGGSLAGKKPQDFQAQSIPDPDLPLATVGSVDMADMTDEDE